MQAQKEMDQSTSNFFKENFTYPEPKNRHERRVNEKEQKVEDKKAEKFLKAIGQLESSY